MEAEKYAVMGKKIHYEGTHPYFKSTNCNFAYLMGSYRGTAVAQWLKCCATNRKVTGSIPGGIIGIFH